MLIHILNLFGSCYFLYEVYKTCSVKRGVRKGSTGRSVWRIARVRMVVNVRIRMACARACWGGPPLTARLGSARTTSGGRRSVIKNAHVSKKTLSRCTSMNDFKMKITFISLIYCRCDPGTGECTCKSGYRGSRCEQPCPVGRHGARCEALCACQHDGLCDHETGHCECRPGYTGPHCQQLCKPGYFGNNCLYKCDCEYILEPTRTI